MAKITAIHTGSDWYDADTEYLVLLDGTNLNLCYTAWYQWIKARTEDETFMSFIDWMVKHRGARHPTKDELEIVEL